MTAEALVKTINHSFDTESGAFDISTKNVYYHDGTYVFTYGGKSIPTIQSTLVSSDGVGTTPWRFLKIGQQRRYRWKR